MALIAPLVAAAAALLAGLATGFLLGRRRAAELRRELLGLRHELLDARDLADRDALTGLHNRRYFHQRLEREVARAHRYDRSLALLVLDLDDFKAINDRAGHLAGDAVLAEASACVRAVVRTSDVACRVGGDELAVLLPESTAADAERAYRRLQDGLGERRVGGVAPLSVSAGVAELEPGEDAAEFFRRTDAALYRAKAAGKGQIAPAPSV